MTELRTTNLKLRPCISSDQSDFIDLERDPEVMRFLNGGAVDHENTDPEKVTFLMPRGTEPDVWTVQRIDDGVFVGWIFLSSHGDSVAELATDFAETLGARDMHQRPLSSWFVGLSRQPTSKRWWLAQWRRISDRDV
jgi:hypothetical protein